MSIRHLFPVDKFDFKSSSVLHELPTEDLQILRRHMTTHVYEKGQVVFREGSYPTGIYFLEKGLVKKYKIDAQGREQIIYICNSGELMGFHAVLSEERFLDSAAALKDSEITFIPREDFLETVEKSAVLAKRLLKILSHEFGVLANAITIQGQRPVKDRLILALITLREKFKEPEAKPGTTVDINIHRSDLASMVGTTKETVVRLLRELKDEHIIETSGVRISIININRLLKMVRY